MALKLYSGYQKARIGRMGKQTPTVASQWLAVIADGSSLERSGSGSGPGSPSVARLLEEVQTRPRVLPRPERLTGVRGVFWWLTE